MPLHSFFLWKGWRELAVNGNFINNPATVFAKTPLEVQVKHRYNPTFVSCSTVTVTDTYHDKK
jgi:hypothetical protein